MKRILSRLKKLVIAVIVIIVVLLLIGLVSSRNDDDSSETNEAETEVSAEVETEEPAETSSAEDEDSEYAWDAGELSYLDMSRDELLEIYNANEELLYGEDTSSYSSDEMAAFESNCADQVAEEYGMDSDDVTNIYVYGCDENYFATFDTESVELNYADQVEVSTWGSEVVIKAYITAAASNQKTINKNYHIVCDFIRDYSGTDFDSISYWAVADSTDGEEVKVISFDLSEDIIDTIATQDFAENTLEDYVTDLYVLPSLLD